ncbi:hypothetical protein D9M72_550030 [compost metagenome]
MPSVNSTISATSRVLRGTRPVRAVSTGAPTATPSAYSETSRPAEGRDTPRSAAMVGISPTMTNSVVPMAYAPSVSANRAKGMPRDMRVTGGRRRCAVCAPDSC